MTVAALFRRGCTMLHFIILSLVLISSASPPDWLVETIETDVSNQI